MDAMNIIHTIRRALGLHPQRRAGETNARSAAELVAMCRHDRLYGRRHDDEQTNPGLTPRSTRA
jgi:hypothetical protein